MWTVPAVAVAAAAPAFAASSCSDPAQRRTTRGGTFTRTSNTRATLAFTDPGAAYAAPTATITSVLPTGLSYGPITGTNMQLTTQTLGTIPSIALHQRPSSVLAAGGTRSTFVSRTTFTFSQTMFDLSFTLTDIDSASNDFWDFAYLESADAFTVTGSGANVTGDGTATNTLRSTGPNLPSNNTTSSAGNAFVTFGQVNAFTLVYGSLQNGDVTRDGPGGGDQVIGLGNFTASIGPSGCP